MSASPEVANGPSTEFRLRVASTADAAAISRLIEESVRGLSAPWYSEPQMASALRFVFGVDSQLIADRSYYVIERDDTLVAAGGWSGRQTLFGGDQMKPSVDAPVDPTRDPARIRAFFVHPAWARRGLGRMLFAECTRAAWQAGFRTFELVATLPGEPLYAALGFEVRERFDVALPDGVSLPVARMSRAIAPER